jgi:hypothetical protein
MGPFGGPQPTNGGFMFDHFTDSKGKVHTITISYTVAGKKPSPTEIQKDLREKLKVYGLEVFFSHLDEVQKNDLLPPKRCSELLDNAMEVSS